MGRVSLDLSVTRWITEDKLIASIMRPLVSLPRFLRCQCPAELTAPHNEGSSRDDFESLFNLKMVKGKVARAKGTYAETRGRGPVCDESPYAVWKRQTPPLKRYQSKAGCHRAYLCAKHVPLEDTLGVPHLTVSITTKH